MREQTLITVTLDEIQSRLPFSMLGLDVDNDNAFINEVHCVFWAGSRRSCLTDHLGTTRRKVAATFAVPLIVTVVETLLAFATGPLQL